MLKRLRTLGLIVMWPSAAALLLFFYAQAAWWHWHRLPDGSLIGHAHPFKSDNPSPFQQHQHSTQQLAFLAQFSIGHAATQQTQPLLTGGGFVNFHYAEDLGDEVPPSELHAALGLRAPPFLMFV